MQSEQTQHHLLTLTVFMDESAREDVKQLLAAGSNTTPIEYRFPFSPAIAAAMKNSRGFEVTWRLKIVSATFDHAVCQLLRTLHAFAVEWRCMGPVTIIDKHMFTASRLKEDGTFNQQYINGICAVLQEAEWDDSFAADMTGAF